MFTTFGALAIGTQFFAWQREKDPADRRRRIDVERLYVKSRHGTIAGFASQVVSSREERFDHRHGVRVDDDLQLVVSILRRTHHVDA